MGYRPPRRLTRLITCAALVAGVAAVPGAALAAPAPPKPPTSSPRAALPDPAKALGANWSSSTDRIVTGIGDTDGFHIYVAREKEAFGWSMVATLGSATDLGAWTGYTCVTGSGRYVAAVYAPAAAANKPRLLEAGAYAAIVDLTTGGAREIASDVQLAYFNPACGTGDRVLFTRALGVDGRQADLLAVDAAAGKIASTRRITSQLTTPVPAADADYGIVNGDLVRIDAAGAVSKVATPGGRPFAVRATAHGALDVLTVQNDRAVAERFASGKLERLGDAPRTKLQMFGLAGGRDALVGDTSNVKLGNQSDLSTIDSPNQIQALSDQGHLQVQEMVTDQAAKSDAAGGAPAKASDADRIRVVVRAVQGNRVETGAVDVAAAKKALKAKKAATATGAPGPVVANGGVHINDVPADIRYPVCAVPRNDLHRQVLQPSPNMVEWAVDQAVHGALTVRRPANYLSAGQPAYTPQGMFPAPTGVQVPAQIMLGILAQESNLSQASWHAVPGDSGNPLIANYYGNGGASNELIDYASADCGYGISQVTDGMRLSENTRTTAQQVAIATDYAANIAAGLQIIAQKWIQLQAANTTVNNADPRYIENWFLAVWAYNSGFHPNDGSAYWGVGWLNNPANPVYPSNRPYFLRQTLGDASHPADWPYEEKVMGWIETPQKDGSADKYSQPIYQNRNAILSLPPMYKNNSNHASMLFCGGNACDPNNVANPCPNTDSSCWWHGHASWDDTCSACAMENLAFPLGSPEPPIQRVYPTDCTRLAPAGRTVYVVDDTPINLLGCPNQTWQGKFTLLPGSPPGDGYGQASSNPADWHTTQNYYYSQIDLHQIGAGYMGHTWFTHAYAQSVHNDKYHRVVGVWNPDLKAPGKYDIAVHLPSHGGTAPKAPYTIHTSAGDLGGTPCEINQDWNGKDEWMYLGTYDLSSGAKVELSNTPSVVGGPDGFYDVAYDAMAFIQNTGPDKQSCGTPYLAG